MPSEETKAAEVKPDPKRGLVVKLCEVMNAVGYMQKRGRNATQSYNYATEADVAEMMRTEFAQRNVFIFPNLVKNERVRLERSKTYKDVIESKVTYATDVEIDWTFVDGDTGQEKTCRIPGCSESPGDKGVYVAMTGSEKYLLMKSFLIPTGDDPEDDKHETDGKGSREAAQAVGQEKLEKMKKARENAASASANGTPSLFYAAQPSGQYAITGDRDLLKKMWPQLKGYWQDHAQCFMVSDEQLEVIKFQCETAKIDFHVLKGPKADAAR